MTTLFTFFKKIKINYLNYCSLIAIKVYIYIYIYSEWENGALISCFLKFSSKKKRKKEGNYPILFKKVCYI